MSTIETDGERTMTETRLSPDNLALQLRLVNERLSNLVSLSSTVCMVAVPNDFAALRDRALAAEAFGDLASAVRYWIAAIAAANQVASDNQSLDVSWMRRRLLMAQSDLDQQAAGRSRLN